VIPRPCIYWVCCSNHPFQAPATAEAEACWQSNRLETISPSGACAFDLIKFDASCSSASLFDVVLSKRPLLSCAIYFHLRQPRTKPRYKIRHSIKKCLHSAQRKRILVFLIQTYLLPRDHFFPHSGFLPYTVYLKVYQHAAIQGL